MSTPRARAGVLELDGIVYSTGGYDGACHLLSMEKYNPVVSGRAVVRFVGFVGFSVIL